MADKEKKKTVCAHVWGYHELYSGSDDNDKEVSVCRAECVECGEAVFLNQR